MQITVTKNHTPNSLAFSFTLETGTTFTFFRSVPGDTAPRMQIPGGQPVDCGFVDNPERFGAYGTEREFAEWVSRYVTHTQAPAAA